MRRRALAGAALALAAAGPGVAAFAREGSVSGLHDARYCEVIELRGVPPHASAIVWNTVGLNRCPTAAWTQLDARAIARQRGDLLVVLNGPRHWLVDSASGRGGAVHRFGGLRFRRVGAVPIRSFAALARTPYTDHTVQRTNIWRWRAGRPLFELVAPGGDVYVMQSYAQIVDPRLRLRDLRTLGRRLDLPPGWHYRVRRTRRPYAIVTRRSATVTQDELQDTYQLVTPAPRGPRRRHTVALTGSTRTVRVPGAAPGSVEDRGTVRGTPFGRGRVLLQGTLAGGRLTATYRLTFRRGSMLGTVDAPYTVADGHIRFHGLSQVTGGTGRFRGITGRNLPVDDTNTFDGQHGVLRVGGHVRY